MDVFHAIADPTRRDIIGVLARQQSNLTSLAARFDMSRQAVSLHVKILNECGLVVMKKQGRERHCEAHLERLGEVSVWIEQYKKFWENKLDALEHYLDTIQRTQRHAKRKH